MLYNHCGRGGDIFLYSPIWGWGLRSILSLYQTFKTAYIIINVYWYTSMKNNKFMG